MLELVVAIIFVGASFFLKGIWLLLAFVLIILLISPGVYAMFSAAPFVRTGKSTAKIIMELADLKSDDIVVDLGCGDGFLLFLAEKEGVAKLKGYELSIPTCMWARIKAWFLKSKVEFKLANFWKEDLGDVNVIFCFLMSHAMEDLEKQLWPKLKKGTRLVSHAFKMLNVKPVASKRGVYLYVK